MRPPGPSPQPAAATPPGGRTRLRPLDPRLLRYASAARGYVGLTAALGVATAVLVVMQAYLIADVVASVAMDGAGWAQVSTDLRLIAGVLLARAGVSWAQDRYGHRAATSVVRQLRGKLVRAVVDLGPSAVAGSRSSELTTLATRGLDALDGYLTRYLPQLLLAATVTPGLLIVVLGLDRVSAAIIAFTLPLVPVFMALVGLATQAQAGRRLRLMQTLGAQVLDLVAGLATLRALGRDAGQARRVREVGEAYRAATMKTLRMAFLSALVLETLTTICVALVAVGIGLRLLYGQMDLQTGLTVLIVAPEVYLPLRLVGLHYHASVDGLAAAAQAFDVLAAADDRPADDRPAEPRPAEPRPAEPRPADDRPAVDRPAAYLQYPGGRSERSAPALVAVRLEAVGVVHDGRREATPFNLDVQARPGHIVALAGGSGVGKTTALEVLLGLRKPDHGRVILTWSDGTQDDLADLDRQTWWAHVAWVPQRPLLVPGTIADNVRLTSPTASQSALDEAATATGLDAVISQSPMGWSSSLGQSGLGLSAGQRQRLALTRALVSQAPLVVLDEPTAHLDAATEERVRLTLNALRRQGRAVVVAAHRPSLLALADTVVAVCTGAYADPAVQS